MQFAMVSRYLAMICLFGFPGSGGAQSPQAPAGAGKAPDTVIAEYVQAIGGTGALARISTREVHYKAGHGQRVYYWQKPDKVLLIEGKKRMGFDGGSGWLYSSKKRVTKLPKGTGKQLEIDANPLRYAELKKLYEEVKPAPPETVDAQRMDVLISPNELGATKFYFDSGTHLLSRVEETGETSAYFKHVSEFSDYREVDGVKLPFRVWHDSTEPGEEGEELKVAKVTQNVPLRTEMFSKPSGGAVTLGGKR